MSQIDISGLISTEYDPTIIRSYLEKAVEVELTDTLLGRNICFKIFRFPNNAWSYTWVRSGHTRATKITEFSAPPLVHPKISKIGMEYNEIGVAIGITDKMIRFGDLPLIEMATDASIRAMKLKQDRDIINCGIASVAYYGDGSTPFYMRLQNADKEQGEWKTFKIADDTDNKCTAGNSHIIVNEPDQTDYPTPLEDGGTDTNSSFVIETMNRAMRLIEEHDEGQANMCFINPMQVEDIRNFLDFSSITVAPPQFNAFMTNGWVGNWAGIDFIRTKEITPGTMWIFDTSKLMVLGEYSAPFVEGGIRDQWLTWEGKTWRQYYQPMSPHPDYSVLITNLTGDLQSDGSTVLDHTIKADVDAQYTGMPSGGGERAGLPG